MDAPINQPLDDSKFRDPFLTARGEIRAKVALRALDTLWFNTGTLCNLTCRNCYIESSPHNDRLAYLTRSDARAYLDEIAHDGLPTRLIGFTGGEPFMNRDIILMLEDVLSGGLDALVLTNAMNPMRRLRPQLLALRDNYGDHLRIRVSLDHYDPAIHEAERGRRSWGPTIDGLVWLARNRASPSMSPGRASVFPTNPRRTSAPVTAACSNDWIYRSMHRTRCA